MPPKQQSKADLAKKQKVVEDKTFGLKNKNKSKNVQKYVQNLKQSVQPKPDPSKVAAKVPHLPFSSAQFQFPPLFFIVDCNAHLFSFHFSTWFCTDCVIMMIAEKEGGREGQRQGAKWIVQDSYYSA